MAPEVAREAAKAADEARRRFAALPLAGLVPGITRAAFRKRSVAGAVLLADWAAIVGPELAAQTEPRKFKAGLLTIACSGAVAMELQLAAPALMARINTHAGERLVERLRFTQDFVAPVVARPRKRVVAVEVEGVEDEGLRAALARLGGAVKGKR